MPLLIDFRVGEKFCISVFGRFDPFTKPMPPSPPAIKLISIRTVVGFLLVTAADKRAS